MESEDAIKREFKAGDLSFIDAVQRLENMGFTSEEAEFTVTEWEENSC